MSTFPPFEISAPNSVRSSNSYTEIQIQCREGAIYIYIWFLFEEKGAGKQCCRRTCGHSIHRIRSDLQASHRKRFSFSSTSGIFCYVDTIASRSKHDFIFPPLRSNEISHTFLFPSLKKSVSFVSFFSSYIVPSKNLRLTHILSILYLDVRVAIIDINNIDNIGTLSILIYYCIPMWQSIFLV